MGDFATEIICFQSNSSLLYPDFGLEGRKVASLDSSLSTYDSGSSDQQWSTPKALSPDDSLMSSGDSNGGQYPWREVRLDRKNLFCDVSRDPDRAQEHRYYRPRRASSLKTSRTPPGTPKSKAVRFADALGLDLEDVRHVFDLGSPPTVPACAVRDLQLGSDRPSKEESGPPLRLTANFCQPGAASDFLRRVRMHNVALESAFVDVDDSVLSGTVRVMNLAFEKRVAARVSFDEWLTHVDVPAAYVQDSHDGVTDRFSFSVLLPPSARVYGHRVQLAVLFELASGAQFWDNNFGQNYVYSCVCGEDCRQVYGPAS